MRRIPIAAGTAIVLAAAGGGTWYATERPAHSAITSTGRAGSAQSDTSAGTTTAAIVRTDLVSTDQESGTLGFDQQRTMQSTASGTLTALPAPGTVVRQDRVLYTVNLHPVRLFYGSVPMSRTLSAGATDGPDVKQLETNLRALGYDPYREMTIDDTFTAATSGAIDRWQCAHGQTETGRVGPGDVVFWTGPVRVATHHVEVGEHVGTGSPLTDLTSTTRIATVNMPAITASIAHTGDAVTLQLPDGSTTPGTIIQIGAVATAPAADPNQANGGTAVTTQATIPITIKVDRPGATGNLDQAPVTVGFTQSRTRNVLAVPVTALITLSGGGYAVDVRGADGAVRRVPIRIGVFSTDGSGAGDVQISGSGIAEGERVVVPS